MPVVIGEVEVVTSGAAPATKTSSEQPAKPAKLNPRELEQLARTAARRARRVRAY